MPFAVRFARSLFSYSVTRCLSVSLFICVFSRELCEGFFGKVVGDYFATTLLSLTLLAYTLLVYMLPLTLLAYTLLFYTIYATPLLLALST